VKKLRGEKRGVAQLCVYGHAQTWRGMRWWRQATAPRAGIFWKNSARSASSDSVYLGYINALAGAAIRRAAAGAEGKSAGGWRGAWRKARRWRGGNGGILA
jgi:hypothetical protein